jgi:hypothetical protein
MEEYAWRWVHGIIFTVLVLFVNLVFSVFGLTLSLATLGTSVGSISALIFVLLSFILLPIIYGAISVGLSDMFGHGNFPSDIDGKTLALFWIHGLIITIVTLIVTVVLAVFGITFSLAILQTALEGFTALIFAVIAFFVYPYVVGWISHQLTELLH